MMYKAVIYFRGGRFPIPSVSSLPSLFRLFLRLEVSPQIQLRELGMLALPAGENDICSHQTRSLDSKYTKNAFIAEPMSVKGNLKIEATVIVAECIM